MPILTERFDQFISCPRDWCICACATNTDAHSTQHELVVTLLNQVLTFNFCCIYWLATKGSDYAWLRLPHVVQYVFHNIDNWRCHRHRLSSIDVRFILSEICKICATPLILNNLEGITHHHALLFPPLKSHEISVFWSMTKYDQKIIPSHQTSWKRQLYVSGPAPRKDRRFVTCQHICGSAIRHDFL